jgi:hypothetical protein
LSPAGETRAARRTAGDKPPPYEALRVAKSDDRRPPAAPIRRRFGKGQNERLA